MQAIREMDKFCYLKMFFPIVWKLKSTHEYKIFLTGSQNANFQALFFLWENFLYYWFVFKSLNMFATI